MVVTPRRYLKVELGPRLSYTDDLPEKRMHVSITSHDYDSRGGVSGLELRLSVELMIVSVEAVSAV